ncbi:MAG: peptide-binding protein [Elusimicrobiota bacterium]
MNFIPGNFYRGYRYLIAAILFFVFFLNSCRNNAISEFDSSLIDKTPVNGGQYIEASISDAAILNPLLATDSASNDIIGLVYNGLVKYDKNIKLVGDLAESFFVSNKGKTITFKLRKNVKWHDGVSFTSADVMFTYQKLIDPNTRTPFGDDYKKVSKAQAPDAFTFQVTYSEPFSPALESWGMGIIPKHIFQTGDFNTHPANRSPIGTGPYILDKWETDEKIVLKANPHYFEGRPHFDEYIYKIIPDLAVQFLALRQGSLSMMSPTPDQYNGYNKFFEYYHKFRFPAFRYDYIAFNLKNPLFSDRQVRQAIAHAINKKDIALGVYQGYAVPISGPFPYESWAYDKSVPDYEYDIEKAKNFLKEAGWIDSNNDGIIEKEGKNFQFTLIVNQGNKVRESIAQITQENLKKIGIKMDIRILEWSVFLNNFVNNKNFEACVLGWNVPRDPDPYTTWHSSQMKEGGYNFVSYKNEDVDGWIVEAQKTFDQATRQKLYYKIHRQINYDLPYVFLVNPERLPVVHKKILGVETAPAGIGWNFVEWFIPHAWQDRPSFSN